MTDTRADDDGFTLIEMLIACMLTVLVLIVAGGIIASSTKTSNQVTDIVHAETDGQQAARSIEQGIRNSSDFQLSSPNGDDQLVIARTASTTQPLTWTCMAWYWSPESGSIHYISSTTPIIAPTTTTPTGWSILAGSVKPVTGATIFSATGEELTMSYTSQSSQGPVETTTSSAFSRAGSTGDVSCY